MFATLQGLNIRLAENPIAVSSKTGNSLGTGILTSLKNLPYKVRYSFEVCLAHGYLYHNPLPTY
jgi:hypothetical protein